MNAPAPAPVFRPLPASFAARLDSDPWLALGLPRAASRAEISTAFRRLARAYHPDRSAPFLREANAAILRTLYAARTRALAAAPR